MTTGKDSDSLPQFPLDWLLRLLTGDEVRSLQEKFQPTEAAITGPDRTKMWRIFFEAFKDGDEIWEYTKPKEQWEAGRGHGGYVILRHGGKVAMVWTHWN